MKTALALFLLAASLPAHAQRVFSEDFDYAVGDIAGRGGWNVLDTNTAQNLEVSSGNLSYPGYSDGFGNCAHVVSGAGKDDAFLLFSPNSYALDNLYVSFLIRVNEWQPISGVYPFCLMPGVGLSKAQGIGDEDICRLTVYCPAANRVQFGIQRSAGDAATDSKGNLFWNDTHPVFLIVIKYDFNQQVASLFVNPDLSQPEPSPDASNTSGKEFLDLQRIQLRQGNSDGDYDVNIDAIRVFLTWGDGLPPIQLSSFDLSRTASSHVMLNWTTSSETNNYGFNVQRQLPGERLFSDIPDAFVPGHGTTTVPQQYSYIDGFTAPEGTAYRLRQTDIDGSTHFSEEEMLQPTTGVTETVPATFALQQNYPNPFNPSTLIEYTVGGVRDQGLGVGETGVGGQGSGVSVVRLVVYDLLGREVATLVNAPQVAGTYSVRFDASAHPSGVYYYELSTAGHRAMKKMLLLR